MNNKLPEDIERLLHAMKEMSQCEDWSESRAQEIVLFGGELYDKYRSDNHLLTLPEK